MTDPVIYPYERVDDLQRNGYRIIQNPDWFCFGMDAVLLSAFASVKPGEQVLDMCTGTGVIPILLEARTEGSSFTGLEIQEPVAEMARRSVVLNRLNEKVSIVNGDVKEASSIFGRASFDIVTCNPPYMNNQHGLQNPSAPKAIARHELLCTFDDVAREAAACLRPGGRFYLVHRPRRFMDLITTLRVYKLEPKRMRFVHPFADREANMVLIEAFRGGGVQMHVDPPLVVYRDVNEYTDEVRRLYEM
ncbi:MAG: tRNA1(Val) (adenine(37)-N6)-methyltransferase [Lachnospiraceae bacterium]|nr:tRNA1(Val) (adenine(37)-N6)-methyltransferase [Lachnospiraceae bacterium]